MNNKKQVATAKRISSNINQKADMERYIKQLEAHAKQLELANAQVEERNQALQQNLQDAQDYILEIQNYAKELENKVNLSHRPITEIDINELPLSFGDSLELRLSMFLKYLNEGNIKVVDKSLSSFDPIDVEEEWSPEETFTFNYKSDPSYESVEPNKKSTTKASYTADHPFTKDEALSKEEKPVKEKVVEKKSSNKTSKANGKV